MHDSFDLINHWTSVRPLSLRRPYLRSLSMREIEKTPETHLKKLEFNINKSETDLKKIDFNINVSDNEIDNMNNK